MTSGGAAAQSVASRSFAPPLLGAYRPQTHRTQRSGGVGDPGTDSNNYGRENRAPHSLLRMAMREYVGVGASGELDHIYAPPPQIVYAILAVAGAAGLFTIEELEGSGDPSPLVIHAHYNVGVLAFMTT